MDSNNKEKQYLRHDSRLKNKMLSLREQDYDKRKGWHQLAGLLATEHKPVRKRPKAKIFIISKMVAAAIILLVIGFFSGRLTAKRDLSPQQTAHLTPLSQDLSAAQTISGRSKASTSDTESAGKNKIALAAKRQHTENTSVAPQKQTAIRTQKSRLIKHAALQNHNQNAPTRLQRPLPHPDLLSEDNDPHYALNQVKIASPENPRPPSQPDNHTAYSSKRSSEDKSLPVMSLAEINSISSLPPTQTGRAKNGMLRQSVYKKLGNYSGSSSSNPFRVRF